MPDLKTRPVEDGWVRRLTATDENLDQVLFPEARPVCGTQTTDWHPRVPGEAHGTFRNPWTGATDTNWYCFRCAAMTYRLGWWTPDAEYLEVVEARAKELDL